MKPNEMQPAVFAEGGVLWSGILGGILRVASMIAPEDRLEDRLEIG
jgi:hypothetical protein